ncbi:MAG: endolytic transglycosylase MltG, partial [Marinilabiliales bacterium]|nr:endolytic transglycosylase MltG [Marinilabiliales bacterium]
MIGFLKNKQATQKLIRKTVPFFRKIFDTTRRLVRKAGWKRLALAATCLILLIGSLVAYTLHKRYFGPNVVKSQLIFIRQGENLASVIKTLKDNSLLENYNTFERLARWKDYDTNIHPGAFRIQTGWSNNQLINVLSSGAQTPVMVTFNYIRTREELAGRLARQMEYDSAAFLAALKSDSVAQSTGMKLADLPVIFLPNTYSFYWTTHPAAFVTRMKREYDAFWNDLRRQKAKSLGL